MRALLRYLPQEIIQEILTRSPVKSLLRFKSVARSWSELISSENFVKAHVSKSPKDACFIRLAFSCFGIHPRRTPQLWPHEWLDSYDSIRDRSLGVVEERSDPVLRSCRGLVCCFSASGKGFMLWNPCTRKYRILPTLELLPDTNALATSCGFGYVDSSDDYKVVALLRLRKIQGMYHCMAKVYSLKEDCWRIAEGNYRLQTPIDATARYLGGNLYWLRAFAVGEGKKLGWEIISFDLEKEAFGTTIEQPRRRDVLSEDVPTLGVLRGDLCVLLHSSTTGGGMAFLVLDSNNNTWTRMACMPAVPYTRGLTRPTDWLSVAADGSIIRLLHVLKHALCYRPTSAAVIRRIYIDDLDVFRDTCAHVESLVSLGSGPQVAEASTMFASIIGFEMVIRERID